MSTKGRRWALAGITWLAFALGVIGLDWQSLWRDEVDAIRFAQFPLPDLLRTFVSPGQNGPLYFLVLRPWLALAGDSEFALRFLSLFCGVLAVPLTYRLALELFRGAGQDAIPLLAALLAATSPYLVWYGQEGKMYTVAVVLVLASMICYLAALKRGGWTRWLGYVAATTAAFYVHLIAALIIPAQLLIFALGPWDYRARWRPWLLSLAALTLPYLPLLAWQLPALGQVVDTGYPFLPLDQVLLSLLIDYSLGIAPAVTHWAAALFVALLTAGLLFTAVSPRKLAIDGQSRRAARWVLGCWLLAPILALFLVTLRRPMFTTRYLVFVLPAYLALLAAGVAAIGRWSRPAAGLFLVALLALNGWGLWIQAHTPLKADFRAATYYLIDRVTADDLVLFQIPYGRYSFDYYVKRWSELHPGEMEIPLAYRWAEGLYTNTGLIPDEAARRMAEMTAGSRTVWLVATEVSMWDAPGLVQSWLDEHATLADQAAFTRVTVYGYVLTDSR